MKVISFFSHFSFSKCYSIDCRWNIKATAISSLCSHCQVSQPGGGIGLYGTPLLRNKETVTALWEGEVCSV